MKEFVRPAWVEVDRSAVAHNIAQLTRLVAPAAVCAVVKADGYGHGAVEVARAALLAGARWLAVALVEEGRTLRDAGVDAPVLVLSEPPPEAMAEMVSCRLTPTIYTEEGLAALREVSRRGEQGPIGVHVKVDTGMHRVGADPKEAADLAVAVAGDGSLRLEGLWTHFAVADEMGDTYTAEQLARFDEVTAELGRRGVTPAMRHAANSAGALWHPASRLHMVRCGIAVYGLAPGLASAVPVDLRPAMSLKARVSYVKTVAAGERVSYGLRYRLDRESVVATVPLGYADGVIRALGGAAGQVLIKGRRRPVAGTVTMDQILVDCGPGADVRRGDEVVLIGRQGDESIGAWEWASAVGTIAYEVVCGISARVPRVYLDSAPELSGPAGATSGA